MFLKFLVALAISGLSIAGGSLLWPKFTKQNRPEVLEQVHDLVVETEIGKKAADTLGVSDDKKVEQININQLAGTVFNNAVSGAQKKLEEAAVGTITTQLIRQIELLSPSQKVELQEVICKPTPAAR